MFSWHQGIFDRFLKKTAQKAQEIEARTGISPVGWMSFFEENQSELFKKYNAIEVEINQLWDRNDSTSMDRFKELSKQLTETTIWVFEKFIEAQQQKAKAQALAGKQEGLGHWEL